MPKKKVVKKAQKRHKRNRQRYADLHGYGPRPKQIRQHPPFDLEAATGLSLLATLLAKKKPKGKPSKESSIKTNPNQGGST